MEEQGRGPADGAENQELELDAETVQDLEPDKEGAEDVVGGRPEETVGVTCTCQGC